MRKSIFLSVLALAAVVSCQKSEIVDSKYGNETIGFETYLGRDAQTKASVANLDALKETGFGAFGFYTATADYAATTAANLMNDITVSWGTPADADAPCWYYSPVKYWTNATDKYTFLAYAPATLTASQATDAAPTISYEVPANLASQTDVLYSNNVKNTTKSEGVNLTFKHALSRVTVKAKAEMYDKEGNKVDAQPADGYDNTYTITGLSLTGAYNTTGTFDLNLGKWASASTPTTAPVYSIFTGTQELNATYYDFAGEDNYLFLIPTTAPAATLTISYTVTYAGNTSAVNTATVNLTNPIEQGKAYSINLTLQRDPDNEIKFNVTSVDNWITEENPEVVLSDSKVEA